MPVLTAQALTARPLTARALTVRALGAGEAGEAGINPLAFITEWDTTKAGVTASDSIRIPLVSGSSYNFHVDWGDGNEEDVVGSALTQKDHTYSTGGVYTVTITGTFPRIYFNNTGDRRKLLKTLNLGAVGWTSFERAFYGCTNLVINATDLPNTAAVTTFYFAWSGCTGLTSFPLLDTSAVINFQYAWSGCTGLTSFPLLDTSAVINFQGAWSGCTGLTSFPLLDTSKGTNFSESWKGCNQLISFPALNVGAGTNFYSAWEQCTGLTSVPLFNMSQGTGFARTWYQCTSLTTLAAGLGSTMGAGNSFDGTFYNDTLTTESYSQFLIELEAANIKTSRVFHGGNSQYNAAGKVAWDALVTRGWTITDGGAA